MTRHHRPFLRATCMVVAALGLLMAAGSPAGAQPLQAGERVAAHLSQRMVALAHEQRDSIKLFVGHGAAFRHAAYHLGVLEFGQIRQLSMYHCRPVMIEYLPGGQWRHLEGEWKLRQESGHFTD